MNASPFIRDRFTWLAYAMLGFFAYYQGVPGVAMPLFRDDLNLSYTVGGMHISAMAVGSVFMGLTNERFVAWWGRRTIFWGGGAGMAAGGLIFIAGRHPAITIPAAFVMGLFGTALLITIQASLADHHGARRAIALTESNVAASASLLLPGLLVGGFERVGIGWRGAFVVPVLVWMAVYTFGNRETVPSPSPAVQPDSHGATARNLTLPRVFWFYWGAVALVVAVEWSMTAWSADFLVEVGELRKDDASMLMTLYFFAMMLGRLAGSRLTRYLDIERLLVVVLGIGVAGFAVFWLAPIVSIMVAGLFVAGLGIANLFPFLLAITMGTAPDLADEASSRLSVAAGLAILIAPQMLGGMADQTGIQAAFGLVFVLFVLAALVAGIARRVAVRGGDSAFKARLS